MIQPIEFANVLPEELHSDLYMHLYKKGWRLKNRSHSKSKRFWTQYQADNPDFKKASKIVLDKIKEHTNRNIKCVRIHCNGQTAGQDGTAHTDFVDDEVWTFIYFSNLNWDVRMGGGFNVLNPKLQQHQYYHYAPNYGVLIKSNWPHWGDCPNFHTDELRTSIAFSYTVSKKYDTIRKIAKASEVGNGEY